MPIENRDLVVEGARLKGRYKKQDFACEVGRDGEGNLVFKIDGKEFGSVSKAASHAMGGASVNGWRFWDIEGAATATKVAANSAETSAKADGKARGTRKGKRLELITFLKGDHTKYWCAACQEAYPIEVGALLPDACPKGHRADDPELVEAAAPEPVEAADGHAAAEPEERGIAN